MKVCFAVDGTAISEGAFDCKFEIKVADIGPNDRKSSILL